MIQSESLTWPAVVAQAKTVTRRNWKPSTAAWYRKGRIFDAYDKVSFHGGVRVARCQCTHDTYQECLGDMPDDDWAGEGFKWMNEHPLAIPEKAREHLWSLGDCSFEGFIAWRSTFQYRAFYVCRFVVIEVEPVAVTRLANILLSDGVLKA